MDKSKEPTYNQIQTLFGWAEWAMPHEEALKYTRAARKFTKQEVFLEIGRLHKLKSSRFGRLTKDDLMQGKIGKKMLEEEK